MVKLNQEQTIAVGALGLLLLACVLMLCVCFYLRIDASRELVEKREMLARLEARPRSAADGHRAVNPVAPASAYLDAPTEGLASAQLQAYVAQLATAQQAVLMTSGIETGKREDAADSIRMQATFDITLKSLQAMLHQLETGTPYVFVEELSVQISPAQRGAPDPLLRVTMNLRALWRRRAA
jgi:general secretion pathway protein M